MATAGAMTRRGWVLFVALGIVWGLPYFLIKISVRELSPALLVLIRTGGGAVILVPFAAARGALVPVLRRWRPLVAYTVVELGVPWFVLFRAERNVSSSLAALLIASVPLFAAVVAWLTRSDRLSAFRVGGLLLGFGGVAVLVGFDVGHSDVLAAASLGVVGLGYALGPWILARHFAGLPGLGVVAASLALCALAYCPLAVIGLPTRPLAGTVVASAVTLTLVCTVVAFLMFFALIAEVGAVRTTIITYLNPVVALALGVFALGERVGPVTMVGFVLIVAGCIIATRPVAVTGPALETTPVAEP
ncbi:MAG: DMT family transporter [Acidimicrobiales bacterium]